MRIEAADYVDAAGERLADAKLLYEKERYNGACPKSAAEEIFIQRDHSAKCRGGMVGGWIISNSFEALTAEERQQKIWKLFDANLTEKDREHIVGFLTFTPLEKKMAFDDDSSDFTASSKRVRKPIATRGNDVMGRKAMSKSKQTAAAR